MASARTLIDEHIAAFNAHDTARLLAGLTDDVVWATGQDVFRGRPALGELFDDGLWAMAPSLRTLRVIAEDDAAAAELHEQLTIDGMAREFTIAAFFSITDGLISRATIYREGSADIE
jgi:ketosteroid isomerase-like protein